MSLEKLFKKYEGRVQKLIKKELPAVKTQVEASFAVQLNLNGVIFEYCDDESLDTRKIRNKSIDMGDGIYKYNFIDEIVLTSKQAVDKADFDLLSDFYRRRRSPETGFSFVYPIYNEIDKTTIWVNAIGKVLEYDDQGCPMLVTVVYSDVTRHMSGRYGDGVLAQHNRDMANAQAANHSNGQTVPSAKYQELLGKAKKLKIALDQRNNQVESLKKQVEAIRIGDTKRARNAEVEGNILEIKRLTEHNQTLQKDRNVLAEDVKALKSKLRNLESELQYAESANQTRDAKDLRKHVRDLEKQIITFKEKTRFLEDKIRLLDADKTEAESDVSRLREQVAKAKSEVKVIAEKNAKLERKTRAFDTAIEASYNDDSPESKLALLETEKMLTSVKFDAIDYYRLEFITSDFTAYENMVKIPPSLAQNLGLRLNSKHQCDLKDIQNLGYSYSHTIGKQFETEFTRFIQGNRTMEMTLAVRNAKQENRWFNFVCVKNPSMRSKSKFKSFLILVHDVTEMASSKGELDDLRYDMDLLGKTAGFGMYSLMLHSSGKDIVASDKFQDMLGLHKDTDRVYPSYQMITAIKQSNQAAASEIVLSMDKIYSGEINSFNVNFNLKSGDVENWYRLNFICERDPETEALVKGVGILLDVSQEAGEKAYLTQEMGCMVQGEELGGFGTITCDFKDDDGSYTATDNFQRLLGLKIGASKRYKIDEFLSAFRTYEEVGLAVEQQFKDFRDGEFNGRLDFVCPVIADGKKRFVKIILSAGDKNIYGGVSSFSGICYDYKNVLTYDNASGPNDILPVFAEKSNMIGSFSLDVYNRPGAVLCSSSYIKMLGLPKNDTNVYALDSIWKAYSSHSDDSQSSVRRSVTDFLSSGESINSIEFINPIIVDGKSKIYKTNMIVIERDLGKKLVKTIGVVTDITSLKRG